MKARLFGVSSLLLVLNPTPASAEIAETSPGRFACNTPAAGYERTDIRRFANGDTITGRFRYLAGTHDRSRMPVAGYVFRFHTGEVIEVHVGADPRYRNDLVVDVGLPGAGSQTVARVRRGTPVEVTAGVVDGMLTVSTGGRSRQIPVGARRITGLEASCQSGRFEIEFPPNPPDSSARP